MTIIRGASIDKILRVQADGELFCVEERSFEQGKEEGYKNIRKELNKAVLSQSIFRCTYFLMF